MSLADIMLSIRQQKLNEEQFRADQAWKEMDVGLDQQRFLMELEDKTMQRKFERERLDLSKLEERRLKKRDRMMDRQHREDLQFQMEELAARTRERRAMEAYRVQQQAQAALAKAVDQEMNLIKLYDDQVEFSTKNLKPGQTEDPTVTAFRREAIARRARLGGLPQETITELKSMITPYTAPKETLEPGQAASFITGLAPHLDAKGLSDLTKSMEKATGIDFPELSLDQQSKLSDVQKIEMTVAQNLQKGGRIDEAALKQAMDSIAAGKGIPFDAMAIAPPKSQALDALSLNTYLALTPGKEGKLKIIARQMTAQAPSGKEFQVVDVNAGWGTDLRVMEYNEAVAAGVEEKELKKFAKHGQTPANEKKRRGMETKAALEALGVK